jgi:RNA polymerase sigma factor (sigma-70 family)
LAFDSLLAAAREGAPWAFESLYRDLAPAVAGYLRVQGASEPYDLTSEVFERAFTRIHSFSGTEAQFRSWVFAIAHNRLIDDRRRLTRRPEIADGIPELVAGNVEDEAMRRIATERVRRLCGELAPDQRDVILLRMVAALTVEEVAAVVRKSPGAVKALQRRGVAALRRRLEHEGVPL